MANVLNRATRQYLRSVHDPDYPVQDWIHNPDLSAVVGFDSKYWVIAGDAVTLMDQAAMDAVDAGELVARRDNAVSQLGETEDVLRAFALIVLDVTNLHSNRVNANRNALSTATSLADAKAKAAAIEDCPVYTVEQLITAIRNRLGS